MLTETDSPRARAQIAHSLLVSFACQCCSSVLLHVLVPQGRSVRSVWIMEAGDKERLQRQNETQSKDRAKWNNDKTPDLCLRRRRGTVASEDNGRHPTFSIRRQLPSKQKEMSCCRSRQWDCKCTSSNIHRLGKPFLIALETVTEKIRIPCSRAKKIRIRNLRFQKIHFRERYRKAPFWGPSVFKNLGKRADTCDRFYVSGFEKLRFRKDPGTCARSLRHPDIRIYPHMCKRSLNK